MRSPKGFFVVACVSVATLLPRALCRGEEPDPLALVPQLSEIESFYSPSSDAGDKTLSPAPRPPDWLGDAQAKPDSLQIAEKLRSLPGVKTYDLSRPPVRRHWVNMLAYAVFGVPRDLIDALFGVAGRVPIFNVGITGGVYEIVPTQALMRPWEDWHKWPGYANRHGHGWIDAPAWGFFPNFHFANFTSVDEVELRSWRAHNERVNQAQESRNAQIEREGTLVETRRTDLVEKSLEDYRAGNYRAAVRDLTPYVEIVPSDGRARAILVASLVSLAPGIAEREWAEGAIGGQVRAASKNMLVAMKEELTALSQRAPGQAEPLFWLVWIDTRLHAYGEALEAASRLEEMDPANVTWRRLRLESALESRVPDWIDQAARAIQEMAGPGAEVSIHARGRQALASAKPAEAVAIYEYLARSAPRNSRYHYLLGMALVEQAKATNRYDKRRALKELGRASRLAGSETERDVYLSAREAARAYRPGKGSTLPASRQDGSTGTQTSRRRQSRNGMLTFP